MPNQHRPTRYTTNYQIPVWGDDVLADWVTAWGATADAADSAMFAAAAAAAAAGAPSSKVVFKRTGTVLTQAVETRPDGSQRLLLFGWANDRLATIRRFNPTQTDTLTYDAAGSLVDITTTNS